MPQTEDNESAIRANVAMMQTLLEEIQDLLDSSRSRGVQTPSLSIESRCEVPTPDQLEQSRLQMKKALAYGFWKNVKRQGLTQKTTSLLVGMSQQKVSDLMRQNVTGFSERKIIECLVSVGCDIEIIVRPGTGQIRVDNYPE